MKKHCLFAICIFLILLLGSTLLFACQNKGEENTEQPLVQVEEEKPLVLFLGDSIGEGVAGVSPLTEREAYAYYGIIGNCNGFTYYDRAVSGATTSNLASYVKREDDGLNMVKTLLTAADVIHISIIGNDFLNSNHGKMLIALAQDDYTDIPERKLKATQKLDEALTTIRTLNPDATIILQTLYNPAGEDSALFSANARRRLSDLGVDPSGFHDLMAKMITEINLILTDYLAAHTVTNEDGTVTAPFELIDVHAAFEKIYQEDPARWEYLFCKDGVHPSNEGHALIAGVLQQKLTELGLASPTALHAYKRDKVAQLKRLFGNLPDFDSVRVEIMGADDFDGVTKAYFDGTRGVTPHYDVMPEPQGETFAQDKNYEITLASLFGYNVAPLLKEEESGIEFLADGTYRLTLTLNSMASGAISSMIAESGGIDVDDYISVELLLPYVRDIAPEIETTDLEGLVRTLATLYGIQIQGLDFQNPAVQEVARRFREQQKLVINDPKTLDKKIAFTFTGKYRLEEMTNPLTGEKLRVIYVNNGAGRKESYVRYTIRNVDGEESVRMTIDVVHVEVEGVLREED